jgi:hypothetical protein
MGARARLWTATIIAGLVGGYAFAWDPAPDSTARSGDEASADQGPDQGPSVQIAKRVVEAAGAFDRYVRTASAVSPEFDGAAQVSGALMASAAYDSRQLGEGAVAYAALVALQEPTFVEALQKLAADPSERAAYVERLTATPEDVLDVPGASQAAALASTALNDMGSGLIGRGRSVKQAAYTVQRQSWALEPVAQPAERLAELESAGANPSRLSDDDTHQLLASIVARRRGAQGASASSRPTPTVTRGLALAAAAVLGRAGEDRGDALAPLLTEPESATCLRRAKLNLHQCVAASGPQYEDVFCAGQHAMVETGQCIVTAAGGSTSGGIRVPVARAFAPAAPQSVTVPVARTSHTISVIDPAAATPDPAPESAADRDSDPAPDSARDEERPD